MTPTQQKEIREKFDKWYREQKEMNPYIMRDFWLDELEARDTVWEDKILLREIIIKGQQFMLDSFDEQWIEKAKGMSRNVFGKWCTNCGNNFCSDLISSMTQDHE